MLLWLTIYANMFGGTFPPLASRADAADMTNKQRYKYYSIITSISMHLV